jgi:Flp pilus assembly protein TadG
MVRKQQNNRTERGALSSLFLGVLIFVLLIAGSMACDLVHGFHVRKQLQVAADSGALAGTYMLTAPMISDHQKNKSAQWAREMVGRNVSDGAALLENEGTEIEVNINSVPFRYPHTCRVRVTKQMPTMFARFVGIAAVPVSASATGGAYGGLQSISPSQIIPLGITHKGGTGKVTLQLDPSKAKQNATWLSDWRMIENPGIEVGSTSVTPAGNSETLALLTPGSVFFAPVVKGGDDDAPMPKNQEIIGTAKMTIIKVKKPTEIDVDISGGGILRGRPGAPLLSRASAKDAQFAIMHQAWRILLLD